MRKKSIEIPIIVRHLRLVCLRDNNNDNDNHSDSNISSSDCRFSRRSGYHLCLKI